MERTEYMRLCQDEALHPGSHEVQYNGMSYRPYAYVMKFDSMGNVLNLGTLKDMFANSVVEVKLTELKGVK